MPVEFSLEGLIEGGGNCVVHTRLGRIDVMQWVKGVDGYAELRAGAEEIVHPAVGHPVLIAGVDDLLMMKDAAGRDVDRIDITALRMAQGLEE
jgi:hypothetical protein